MNGIITREPAVGERSACHYCKKPILYRERPTVKTITGVGVKRWEHENGGVAPEETAHLCGDESWAFVKPEPMVWKFQVKRDPAQPHLVRRDRDYVRCSACRLRVESCLCTSTTVDAHTSAVRDALRVRGIDATAAALNTGVGIIAITVETQAGETWVYHFTTGAFSDSWGYDLFDASEGDEMMLSETISDPDEFAEEVRSSLAPADVARKIDTWLGDRGHENIGRLSSDHPCGRCGDALARHGFGMGNDDDRIGRCADGGTFTP